MVCAYRSSPEHPTSPRKQELQLLLHHPKAEHLLAGAGKALGRAAQCIAVSNHRHTAVAMQGVAYIQLHHKALAAQPLPLPQSLQWDGKTSPLLFIKVGGRGRKREATITYMATGSFLVSCTAPAQQHPCQEVKRKRWGLWTQL